MKSIDAYVIFDTYIAFKIFGPRSFLIFLATLLITAWVCRILSISFATWLSKFSLSSRSIPNTLKNCFESVSVPSMFVL